MFKQFVNEEEKLIFIFYAPCLELLSSFECLMQQGEVRLMRGCLAKRTTNMQHQLSS